MRTGQDHCRGIQAGTLTPQWHTHVHHAEDAKVVRFLRMLTVLRTCMYAFLVQSQGAKVSGTCKVDTLSGDTVHVSELFKPVLLQIL